MIRGAEPSTAASPLGPRLAFSVAGVVIWGAAAIVLAARHAPTAMVVVVSLVAFLALVNALVVARRSIREHRTRADRRPPER